MRRWLVVITQPTWDARTAQDGACNVSMAKPGALGTGVMAGCTHKTLLRMNLQGAVVRTQEVEADWSVTFEAAMTARWPPLWAAQRVGRAPRSRRCRSSRKGAEPTASQPAYVA